MGEVVVVCIQLINPTTMRHYQHAAVALPERKVVNSCGVEHVGCVDHMECEVARDWVLMNVKEDR